MAPPAIGAGFGNAAYPAGMGGVAGVYIIANTSTNNRYVGISSDLGSRFNTRLAVITEMGFSADQMGQVGVCWGSTFYEDTNSQGVFNVAVPASHQPYVVVIDGYHVNLEHLLIRFVMTQLGAGGTVSNNIAAQTAYVNSSPDDISVRLTWGGMGGLFTPGFADAVWVSGAAW